MKYSPYIDYFRQASLLCGFLATATKHTPTEIILMPSSFNRLKKQLNCPRDVREIKTHMYYGEVTIIKGNPRYGAVYLRTMEQLWK